MIKHLKIWGGVLGSLLGFFPFTLMALNVSQDAVNRILKKFSDVTWTTSDITILVVAGIFFCMFWVIVIIWYNFHYEEISNAEIEKRKQAEIQTDNIKKDLERNNIEVSRIKEDFSKKETTIKSLLRSKTPFRDCSEMTSELELSIFDQSAHWLKTKRPPAARASEEVKAMRSKVNEIICNSKALEYRLQFIEKIFPEIHQYLESDEDLLAITEYSSYQELEDNQDRSKNYLTDEEYRSLSSAQRNQLALDRYIKSRSKTKWAIGRDYEMYCAWYFEQKGYYVIRNGILQKLNDCGRDLIMTRHRDLFDTIEETWVVQCKYWSPRVPIRENVIMQLYGSKVAYIAENNLLHQNVIAALVIPDSSVLSETAIKFTKILGIKIIRLNLEDFPRIKCNVNGSSKIYHLPFDQQYDRTEICNKGEFYALTVAEAEQKGFRRAMRHFIP